MSANLPVDAETPQERIDALTARLRKLAEDKSNLQLIVRLMERVDPLPGVEDMIRSLLASIVETIGGTNIKLYYWIGAELHYADFGGRRDVLAQIDDPVVARVAQTRMFIEHPGDATDTLLTKEQVAHGAWIWAFPLVVGSDLIGIIKIENLHVSGASLRSVLPVFFSHAALILSNEIRSFNRRQAEQALARSEANIRLLVQKVPIALSHTSTDFTILETNNRFVELFGYTLDEVPTLEEWWPRAFPDPAYRQELKEAWNVALAKAAQEGSDFLPPVEVRVVCKDGGERIVEVSTVMVADGAVTSFIDLTERKRAEEIQKRLNRELRAISDCNQALLRAEDEQVLLDEVCNIICGEAGYLMAWVGYAEHDDAKTVRPQAWAGEEAGYLSLTRLTWADTPAGRRPFGIAIRSGEASCAQDFSSEPWSASWTAEALQRGYRSGIALPLKDDAAGTFGALCIYSAQTNAFTPDEIKLLDELAGDLAYGIAALRLRARQDEAKRQLVASEQLFRALVENSPDPIARYDRELRRVYVNPAIRKLFQHPVEQVLGATPATTSPLVDPDSYMANIRRVIESAEDCIDEGAYRTLGGEIRWSSWRFTPELGADGKVATVLVVSHDITERKQAEEERRAHMRFLESMDRVNRAIQGTNDVEHMMGDVLQVVLDVFACDRAFLLHPCDPGDTHWTVPMERTRPEYPGVLALGQAIPMDTDVANTLQTLLDHPGPLLFGLEAGFPLPRSAAEQFSIKSIMSMALHPKTGKPWQLGLHQCSRVREWTPEEVRLFEGVGRRISDALGTLLTTRDLRESEERFRLVFENSPVPIWEADFSLVKARLDEIKASLGGDIEDHLVDHPECVRQCAKLVRLVDVNRAAIDLHAANSKSALFRGLAKAFTDQSYVAFRQGLGSLARGETEMLTDSAVRTLAGERREVTVYLSVCPGYEQTLAKVLVSLIDITERKRSEDDLRLAASVFATSQEGILISDAQNRIIDINPAFTTLTGYERDEALGRNPGFLGAGRQSPAFYADMWRTIETKGAWQGELWNRRKSGEVYAELLSVIAVKDQQGRLEHYVGAFSDISVIKEHEADLDRIAHYDALTSVPNRRLLGDRLEQAIARAQRLGKNLAVCYLDLDGFKPINDQYGHGGGDRLLVEIARRLQAICRADDTVARLGGDEFVILWNDIGDESECSRALERILEEVSTPMLLDGVQVSVSASVGVTMYPDDDVDADSLLRHADHAMYSAKQLGKNRYQVFDSRLERQISSRADFLAKVTRGLDCGQFELYYQPKVDCVAGRMVGVEALIRWNDPILGLVGPKEFLPLIENDNLALHVGRWVMDQAVRQGRVWHEAGLDVPISINVFPRHLKYPTFIDDLRNAIANHWPDMPAHRILLEIVESSDLEELDPIEAVISECLGLGIGFSLDDFGTGYSSLVYLRRLSVEELKIDQSFVRDMLEVPDDQAIVAGVIGLGRAFGLRVVAEGVEHEQQARYLVELGCSVVQGYGLGRPMPAAKLQQWLADFSSSPSVKVSP
jgi:diguanylate cyclase (GGDEF)-like protein/PAS domain S-box-containing protein